MEAKLEVGKLCVCVEHHHLGTLKPGMIREILGMKKDVCGCLVVNIGLLNPNGCIYGQPMRNDCKIHGKNVGTSRNDGAWWIHHSRLAPLEVNDETHESIKALLTSAKL